MTDTQPAQYTAFSGHRRVAAGELLDVTLAAKSLLDADPTASVLAFDDATGRQTDLDLHGTAADFARRLTAQAGPSVSADAPRRPGRPKLGVVGREVTLLPRHWEWLNAQPGGASVALRKLIEEARRANEGADRVRHAQDAAYRVLTCLAGDLPGYEEAIRALYAADRERFDALLAAWPDDVREYAVRVAESAFETGGPA